jgi:hypothetical protein
MNRQSTYRHNEEKVLTHRERLILRIMMLEDEIEVPISELSDSQVVKREQAEAKLESLVNEFHAGL